MKYCGQLEELGIVLGKENEGSSKMDEYKLQIAEKKKRLQVLEEAKEYQKTVEELKEIEQKINIGLAFEEYYAGKVNSPAPNMEQIQKILETEKDAIEDRRKMHEENIAKKEETETHAEKVEKAKALSQENHELDEQIAELIGEKNTPSME